MKDEQRFNEIQQRFNKIKDQSKGAYLPDKHHSEDAQNFHAYLYADLNWLINKIEQLEQKSADFIIDKLSAIEYGYKQCEKGHSLQAALLNARRVLNGKT